MASYLSSPGQRIAAVTILSLLRNHRPDHPCRLGFFNTRIIGRRPEALDRIRRERVSIIKETSAADRASGTAVRTDKVALAERMKDEG